MLILLSQSWCKIMKIAFLGEGTDIKWELRTGAGINQITAQGEVKGKKDYSRKNVKTKRQKHSER